MVIGWRGSWEQSNMWSVQRSQYKLKDVFDEVSWTYLEAEEATSSNEVFD